MAIPREYAVRFRSTLFIFMKKRFGYRGESRNNISRFRTNASVAEEIEKKETAPAIL